jgi:ATP-dependent DNA helicase PIF1
VYHSEDYITKAHSDDARLYEVEFLNTLNYSGLPPHTLTLKVGMPIMLLRNINMDGEWHSVGCAVLEAVQHSGKDSYRDSHWQQCDHTAHTTHPLRQVLPNRVHKGIAAHPPCLLHDHQQVPGSGSMAGIFLPAPCFGHGQLYVGMSRLGNPAGLHLMVVGGTDAMGRVCTDNVVFKEVLHDNY